MRLNVGPGEQYTLALAHFAIDFALPPFSSLSLAMPEFTPAPRSTLHTFFSLSDADVTDVERAGCDKYNLDGMAELLLLARVLRGGLKIASTWLD